MKRKTEPNCSQSGQNLVEFALILGVLLFVLLIIIETFSLYRQRYGLDQVAREAARLAAEYGGNAPEVEQLVFFQLNNLLLDTSDVQISLVAHEFDGVDIVPISPPRPTCNYGEFVAVTVTMPWRVRIPGGGLFVNAISQDGTHSASHIDKCWRGE